MNDDPQRGSGVPGSIGFLLVALVVLFTAGGYGLDRWLHTRPWLMVVGVFVGFGLGFTYLVLISKSSASDYRSREGETDDDEGPGKRSS